MKYFVYSVFFDNINFREWLFKFKGFIYYLIYY